MEAPDQFASECVVGARIAARTGPWALLRAGTYNHEVAIDRGRRGNRIASAGKIFGNAGAEVYSAVIAEGGDGSSRSGIDRDQPSIAGAGEDARRRMSVAGPVRDTAMLARPWCLRVVAPDLLPGLRLQGDDSPLLRRDVEASSDDDGRTLELGSWFAGVIRPGAPQFGDVGRRYLFERRKMGAARVVSVGGPIRLRGQEAGK